MRNMRIVSLEGLLERLEQVLGPDSLLLRRFQRGLKEEDEACLSVAMNSLHLYPSETRSAVEDTVMGWLFGGATEAREDYLEAWPPS